MTEKNLKERSRTKVELDVLFQEVFNQDQLKNISRVLTILGKYVLLEQDMLFKIYESTYGEKLGFSYLKKAVANNLVVCYKFADDNGEQDNYFYCLKRTAYPALQAAHIKFLELPYFALQEGKEKLLTYNKFLMENKQTPAVEYPLMPGLNFFITDNDCICYFPITNITSVIETISKMLKIKKDDVMDTFAFAEINLELIPFGNKTKGLDPKEIY
jgi:hypothetical protein